MVFSHFWGLFNCLDTYIIVIEHWLKFGNLNKHKGMEERLHFLPPVVADLPASACAVSRLALQDHAELLEEEHKGTALIPGNTQSPPGAAAGGM